MSIKKIRKKGTNNHLAIFYVGLFVLLAGVGSRIFHFADDYYLYGLIPVWIIFIIVGFIHCIYSAIDTLKYLRSYKSYDNKLIENVNQELRVSDIKNYNNLNLCLTKNYIISSNKVLKIYKYNEITQMVNILKNNNNFLNVITSSGETHTIVNTSANANDDIYDIMAFLQEKNPDITKRSI